MGISTVCFLVEFNKQQTQSNAKRKKWKCMQHFRFPTSSRRFLDVINCTQKLYHVFPSNAIGRSQCPVHIQNVLYLRNTPSKTTVSLYFNVLFTIDFSILELKLFPICLKLFHQVNNGFRHVWFLRVPLTCLHVSVQFYRPVLLFFSLSYIVEPPALSSFWPLQHRYERKLTHDI